MGLGQKSQFRLNKQGDVVRCCRTCKKQSCPHLHLLSPFFKWSVPMGITIFSLCKGCSNCYTSGVWGFLFSADFLFFENFLVPNFGFSFHFQLIFGICIQINIVFPCFLPMTSQTSDICSCSFHFKFTHMACLTCYFIKITAPLFV